MTHDENEEDDYHYPGHDHDHKTIMVMKMIAKIMTMTVFTMVDDQEDDG